MKKIQTWLGTMEFLPRVLDEGETSQGRTKVEGLATHE